jgi:peptide/nickel transport system ATP-binding protein
MNATLSVSDLSVEFHGHGRSVCAVDRLSFSVEAGEVLALVGESGCGKSTVARAIMQLLPRTARMGGSILVEGRDVTTLPERALRDVRGERVSIVFQEPVSSLNPVLSVGYQVAESLRRHARLPRRAARDRAVALLDEVGIADPERRAHEYPHQLSGGMCQRVMLAIALAGNPRLLVADEPTTALDATVQANILELLRGVIARRRMGLLLITHDLGVVADLADRAIVMYAGRAVEEAEATELFERPRHPYTRALLEATPMPGGPARARLAEISGTVPSLERPAVSCSFAERCRRADRRCRERRPEPVPAGRSTVACLHPWEWT